MMILTFFFVGVMLAVSFLMLVREVRDLNNM